MWPPPRSFQTLEETTPIFSRIVRPLPLLIGRLLRPTRYIWPERTLSFRSDPVNGPAAADRRAASFPCKNVVLPVTAEVDRSLRDRVRATRPLGLGPRGYLLFQARETTVGC